MKHTRKLTSSLRCFCHRLTYLAITGLVVLISLFTNYGCGNSTKTHRISEDGGEEILYISGDIALHRQYHQHIVSGKQINGQNIYSVVKAHFVANPDLIFYTGDEIDKTIIDNVILLNIASDKLFYGKYHSKEKNMDLYFFCFKDGPHIDFDSKDILIKYLKKKGIKDEEIDLKFPGYFLK